MGYKQPGYLKQIYWVIKHAITSWIEWQDAKSWAKEYYPGWVQIATKARGEDTRREYRYKILMAYRGIDNG